MAKRYGDLADALEELALHYRLDDNDSLAHDYHRAASELRTAESLPPDPSSLPNVETTVRDHIAEWRAYEKIEDLEEYREERPYLSSLTRIAKVGPKRAKKFYEETGATDISDIRELADTGELESVSGIGPKTATTIRRSIAQLET